MAGHSKWKNIQHRKGAQDKKRGKIFTKALKEISVSVKEGGANLESNPRLRAAIQNAKAVNLPKDNIEKAIKKASGSDADNYIETTFECYGPEGVALFVECATDNNIRTVSNIKSYLNKHDGCLGKDGCLQFVFNRIGQFILDKSDDVDVEELTLELIDVGVEDVNVVDDEIEIVCPMNEFGNIQSKLTELNLEAKEAGLVRIPINTKEIDLETYNKVQKLIDVLEDDDDVQKVYHNIEYSEEFN